jgi:hypothetical protein
MFSHVVDQCRTERQGQVPVGDRAPERSLRGPYRVHVDPLVIAGGLGERIDPVLGHLMSGAVSEVLTDEWGEVLDRGDRDHARAYRRHPAVGTGHA